MDLKRVLGFTSNSRNSFVCQPGTGDLIYVAGCVIVVLNPETRQQQYLISDSKQTITTLAITQDGKHLASADCGQEGLTVCSTIRVWNLDQLALVSTMRVQQTSEVSCLAFSSNNEMLVSVGSQLDLQLYLWDWRRQLQLAAHKLTTRVRSISFAWDNSYFVTCGESHLKYWHLRLLSTAPGAHSTTAPLEVRSIKEAQSIAISCRSASLLGAVAQEGSFCDVKCGLADTSKTFCITKQGLLCELNGKRVLHKWVDLRTASANCLAVGKHLIAVGCANGVVRCFSSTGLRFLKNLPRPHQLGTDIANRKESPGNSPGAANYPSLIGVSLNEMHGSSPSAITISCLYNDRSIYVWSLECTLDDNHQGVSCVSVGPKKYSALYHSSCIWGIDVYPTTTTTTTTPPTSVSSVRQFTSDQQQLLAQGSFVTCSSDDTLRVWSILDRLDDNRDGSGNTRQLVYRDNIFSHELVKIIFTDSGHQFLCDLDCLDQLERQKTTSHYDSNEGLRCLRLSPDGRHLAVGSRSGQVRVFDFAEDRELKSIAAHDAEVLCLEYSDPCRFAGFSYLASSSRDKLIHLFDAADDYRFLQTIDDHSSSITALRFVNNRTDDCLQLISCGTDQKIVFRKGQTLVDEDDRKQLNFVTERLIEGKTTFYDMEVDSESACLMTACQDKMIRLFNVAQVKYKSSFRGQSASAADGGTIIKLALDPSCTFLAASCTDKSVSIFDYQRGECVATITAGLSDLVTDMKFSLDGRHLIGCSGNGCIFVWSSPAEVANASSYLDAVTSHHQQSVANSNGSSRRLEWQPEVAEECPPSATMGQQAAYANLQKLKASTDSSELGGQRFTINSNNNDDYDDDDQRTLRGESTSCPRSSELRDESAGHINADDDGQSSQRYARSRRSSSSSRQQLTSRGELSVAVGNTAKCFQSRENLEKISSRQRYIHDSLFSGSGASGRLTAGSGSLSDRFASQTDAAQQVERYSATTAAAAAATRSTGRAKSLSRLSAASHSTAATAGQQLRLGDAARRRRANSSGDELSSADDNDDSGGADNPQNRNNTIHGGRRNVSAARHQQYGTLSSDRTSKSLAALARRTRYQQQQQHPNPNPSSNPDGHDYATIRSSRSESNLNHDQLHLNTLGYESAKTRGKNERQTCLVEAAFNYPDDKRIQLAGEDAKWRRFDLAKLDPSRVPLSRELCQQVVDELRVASKFATRLHQRLLLLQHQTRSCQSMAPEQLANLVASGIQSSLDVLSIVPPRAQLQPKFRSQLDLSVGGGGDGRSNYEPAAAGGRLQSYLARQPALSGGGAPSAAPRSSIGGGGAGDSSSAANVIGSVGAAEADDAAGTRAAPASSSSQTIGGSGKHGAANAAGAAADHQHHQGHPQTQRELYNHSGLAAGHAGSQHSYSPSPTLTLTGTPAKVSEPQAKRQNEANNNNNNAQLNIDQVLEAYSNRLFKMVQQRMEWTSTLPATGGGGGGGGISKETQPTLLLSNPVASDSGQQEDDCNAS